MAVDPLAPVSDPNPAPALQPGFFDGQMALENDLVPQELAPGAGPTLEQDYQVAGWGKAIKGIKDAQKILKEHELTKENPDDAFDLGRPRKQGSNPRLIDDTPPVEAPTEPPLINADEVTVVETPGKQTAARVPVDQGKVEEVTEVYQRFIKDTPFVALKDFNVNNLTQEQDVLAVIAAQSEVYAKQINNKTGGKIAHQVTEQMADLVGSSQGRLMKKLLGGEILYGKQPGEVAANMLAARDLLLASSQEADRLAKIVITGDAQGLLNAGFKNADEAELAMERQFALNAAIHAQVKGAQTEIARTLSSFNVGARGDGLRQQAISDVLKKAGSEIGTRERAKLYLAIEDPTARAYYLRNGASAKTFDALYEVWINALLSSPVTHTVNLLGNLLFAGGQIPTRTVAGMMGHMRRQRTGATDGVQLGEDAAMALGFYYSAIDAVKIAGKVWMDPTSEIVTKMEPGKKFRVNAASAEAFQKSGIVGQAIDFAGHVATLGRFSTRTLAAGDVLFKVGAQRASIYADALRRAERGGETDPTLFAEDVADGIANPLIKDQERSQDFGRFITFQSNLGESGRQLQGLAAHPLIRWFIPFLKTPVNIINRAWEHTPFKMRSDDYKRAIAEGGEAADLAKARVALGTTTMVAVAGLAHAGYITGGGPSNPKLRRNLERQGWQPYSIRVGGTYISFKRVEPFATVIGLAADLTEIGGNAKDQKSVQTALAALGMAFSKNVTSKTWMTGMANLLEAVENPDRYGPKAVEGFIRSMVPRIVAQAEKGFDPEKRYVRGLVDALKQDVPGWSSSMPADLNIWGEPIVYQSGGAITGMINPFYTKEWKPNDLDGELDRLKIGFDRPPETIPNTGGKLLFDPWEYHDYAEYAGQTAKASLEDLIKTSLYKKSNDVVQQMRIEQIYSQAKARAWNYMLTESKYGETLKDVVTQVNMEKLKELRK